MDQPPRVRLDVLMTDRGLAASRARARDAIRRGCVRVDTTVARKAGLLVDPHSDITVSDPGQDYVSRAALKLVAGLDAFRLDLEGAHVLDLGASTGGFTQVAMERGARHVTAVDVGHGQMASAIADDDRVTLIEGQNARALTADHLPRRPTAIVCDVSFISLKIALPPALALAEPGSVALVLIKPQFEVGRDHIGKGGIVNDPRAAEQAVSDLADWFGRQDGWRVLGTGPSPIEGGDGNREYLLAARKDRP